MATWKPRTVRDVVQEIDDAVYVLPVIQRWLVWNEKKMELLFDSLLKGNSFGGIMILQEERGDVPLFAYRRFSRFGEIHESSLSNVNDQTTYLVIDGQQRLQSFFMGLKGGINGKKLYFDLLSNQLEYDFRFAADASTLPDMETDDTGNSVIKLWHPVSQLFERLRTVGDAYHVAEELIRRHELTDIKLPGKVQQNVLKFYMAVFADPSVGMSSVSVRRDQVYLDQEKQRIVELFRRLNDGGTRLSSLDLVASMFKGFDHRMEQFFREMVQFEDIGIEQDEIIKLLFLLQDNPNKEVIQVTKEDTEFALENQKRIIKTMKGVRRFLLHSRLYDYFHTGGRSDIPVYFIAYHIFHKLNETESLDQVYENFDTNNPDFQRVKRWIYLSLLNGVFSRGCGWIPYRTGIRKILNLLKGFKGELFPVNELFQVYQNHPLRFSEELSAKQVENWDRDFIFYLIYDYQVISNRDIDHIHPSSKLEAANVAPGFIHTTANFQLLESDTNRHEKRAKDFSQWIMSGVTNRDSYLKRHMIPADESMWKIENYYNFLQWRAGQIAARIRENVPHKPSDHNFPKKNLINETTSNPHHFHEQLTQDYGDHPVLKDTTTWLDIFQKSGCGPQWAGRYSRELQLNNINTVSDFAVAIITFRLSFDHQQTHGSVYSFHGVNEDGNQPILRKKHFGGWGWHYALNQLTARGFIWQDFVVPKT
ncbi:MAG: DUF262 domain-containing protein [Ardenticatenaceae bacterium]|nr:DUF262 domain-containing protein [Ardenticatenaceae bacterium]